MSTDNRITKVTRSVKNIFVSGFQPFRAATPSSIDSDVESSRTVVTDTGVLARRVTEVLFKPILLNFLHNLTGMYH